MFVSKPATLLIILVIKIMQPLLTPPQAFRKNALCSSLKNTTGIPRIETHPQGYLVLASTKLAQKLAQTWVEKANTL